MLNRLSGILIAADSPSFVHRSALYLLTHMLVHPSDSDADCFSISSLKIIIMTQVELGKTLAGRYDLELLQLSSTSMWSTCTLFRCEWRNKLVNTLSPDLIIPFVEISIGLLSYDDPIVLSGATAAIAYMVEDCEVLSLCFCKEIHITMLTILDAIPVQAVKQCVCTAIMRILYLANSAGVRKFVSEGAFIRLLGILAHRHTQDLAQRVYGSLMLMSTQMDTLTDDELKGVKSLLRQSNPKLLCYAVLTVWHLARSQSVREILAYGGVIGMIVEIAKTRRESNLSLLQYTIATLWLFSYLPKATKIIECDGVDLLVENVYISQDSFERASTSKDLLNAVVFEDEKVAMLCLDALQTLCQDSNAITHMLNTGKYRNRSRKLPLILGHIVLSPSASIKLRSKACSLFHQIIYCSSDARHLISLLIDVEIARVGHKLLRKKKDEEPQLDKNAASQAPPKKVKTRKIVKISFEQLSCWISSQQLPPTDCVRSVLVEPDSDENVKKSLPRPKSAANGSGVIPPKGARNLRPKSATNIHSGQTGGCEQMIEEDVLLSEVALQAKLKLGTSIVAGSTFVETLALLLSQSKVLEISVQAMKFVGQLAVDPLSRKTIGELGGIPMLLSLLHTCRSLGADRGEMVSSIVLALLNLSSHALNQEKIAKYGLDMLIEMSHMQSSNNDIKRIHAILSNIKRNGATRTDFYRTELVMIILALLSFPPPLSVPCNTLFTTLCYLMLTFDIPASQDRWNTFWF
jgi:hypothetical protein